MKKTFLLIGCLISVAGCTTSTSNKSMTQAPVLDSSTGNKPSVSPKIPAPVLERHDLPSLPIETTDYPPLPSAANTGNSRFRKTTSTEIKPKTISTEIKPKMISTQTKQKACKPVVTAKPKLAKTKVASVPKVKAKPKLEMKSVKTKIKALHKAKPTPKAKHKSKK